MVRRGRLDTELVRRGLARSREHAATLVEAGRVTVRGMPASKPATGVAADTPVIVVAERAGPDWASRGAYKLLGAFERFLPDGLRVAGRRCLDAGASTGGFTDVLLHEGASEVVAVDVGYGQLAWRLRTDSRVSVHDRINVRALDPTTVGGTVELTVADLSFISLRLVLPALLACTAAGGDLVVMVKPQFEIGRERLGAGGVVRDPLLREQAVLDVVTAASQQGAALRGAVASPLPGPSGNVEYFLWLRPDGGPDRGPDGAATEPGSDELVHSAVREGPQ